MTDKPTALSPLKRFASSPAVAAALGLARRHPYFAGLSASGLALGIAILLNAVLGIDRPSRIFLVAILVTAASNGLWPALFASLISALFFDFFFLPPPFSFSIDTAEGMTDFAFFIATALIVTTLAARVRRYAVEADERALTAEKLSTFSRQLADALTEQEVLDTAARSIANLTDRRIALILPDGDHPTVRACHPPLGGPDSADIQAAATWWALGSAEAADARLFTGGWCFQLLRGTGEPPGLLASRPAKGPNMGRRDAGSGKQPDTDALVATLAHQTALALDRWALLARLEAARLRGETERLRAAVLNSISHDLRGPLASIVGATSSLDRQWRSLTDAERLDLTRSVRREAERLDAYIDKLLDITRIESGAIVSRRDAVSVREAVDIALDQAARALTGHVVVTDIPLRLPPVDADLLLLRQVLHNLLENAAKYSAPGSRVRITARESGHTIRISVLDEGVGIAESQYALIFEKFHRAPETSGLAAGTGLGLTICRGFVSAMGGTIEAANRDDRPGAIFAVTLRALPHHAHGEIET